jgi:hypothetical protein
LRDSRQGRRSLAAPPLLDAPRLMKQRKPRLPGSAETCDVSFAGWPWPWRLSGNTAVAVRAGLPIVCGLAAGFPRLSVRCEPSLLVGSAAIPAARANPEQPGQDPCDRQTQRNGRRQKSCPGAPGHEHVEHRRHTGHHSGRRQNGAQAEGFFPWMQVHHLSPQFEDLRGHAAGTAPRQSLAERSPGIESAPFAKHPACRKMKFTITNWPAWDCEICHPPASRLRLAVCTIRRAKCMK